MNIDQSLVPYIVALGVTSVLFVIALVLVWVSTRKQARSHKALITTQASLNEAQQQIRHSELREISLNTEHQALQQRFGDLQTEMSNLKAELREQVEGNHQVQQTLSIVKTQLKEREESFKQQVAQFEQQKQALGKEFELLANKIIDDKGKQFEERSKDQIDAVLKPFKDQIEGFQKRVNDVHTESVQGHTKLESQIKHVLEVGLKMSDEAHSLAQALKGDKKAQGNWSEVQAELLLEMSGLTEGREYEREASFKTDDGRDQRPDFLINLPNDKHIIIDSKISLNAYVQSCSEEDEEQKLIHLKAHVEAIRQHVKSLSDKNYAKLKGLNSIEYIFMFMGSEPAYLAAANHDPSLFQDAYRKGIAIVTPNTLLSSLRIVSHLWSIDKQNNNTRQLAEQASKVYDKLRVFAEKMQKLGNQISTVQKTYDESWATLKDGRGSLVKQVDKFVDMGVAVKEKLPTAVLEDGDLKLVAKEDSE